MPDLAAQSPAVMDTQIARVAVPVGRTLFALVFAVSGLKHFESQTIAYATSTGLPHAGLLVPASGVLAIAGAVGIAVGYRARLAALALIAFLVPVTLMMHAYWNAPDA